ncbi:hypothetical protein GBA52_020797 [Prunus armeniaca]|nr:hypothetical protein GBA52_020797 [Prunus armeniaca]
MPSHFPLGEISTTRTSAKAKGKQPHSTSSALDCSSAVGGQVLFCSSDVVYQSKDTMRLEKCWFCSSTVYPGHGIQFVRNDAKIFRFCRSKCHKNFKMKRNPRKVKWTKAYRRLRGKDMTQDSTFEFERKRNRPERYDRNLTENTLKAIKKIDKVRIVREERHHEKRMKDKKAKENREAVKELEQSISLVKAPTALQHDPSLTLPIKVKVSQQQPEKTVAMME